MTAILGRPALHARHLAKTRLRACVGFGAAAGGLAGAALLLAPIGQMITTVAVGCATLAVLVLGFRSRQEWVKYLQAQVGIRSEERVAAVLNNIGAAVVVHGALVADRAGDLDHLVLGPWAVAVETKTGRGKIGVQAGKLTLNRSKMQRDPLRQISTQAHAAERVLGVEVQRIVCVVDTPSQPRCIDGVWVCSAKDLPAVIAQFPAILGQRALDVLRPKLRTVLDEHAA